MKIYPRYLSSKSPLSERRLTIAPLQFSIVLFFIYRWFLWCWYWRLWRNMKIYPRYLSSKSPLSERRLTIAPLQFSVVIFFCCRWFLWFAYFAGASADLSFLLFVILPCRPGISLSFRPRITLVISTEDHTCHFERESHLSFRPRITLVISTERSEWRNLTHHLSYPQRLQRYQFYLMLAY